MYVYSVLNLDRIFSYLCVIYKRSNDSYMERKKFKNYSPCACMGPMYALRMYVRVHVYASMYACMSIRAWTESH